MPPDETFASDLETGHRPAEQWLAADAGEGFLDARFGAGPFLEALLAFPPSSDKYRAKKPDADAFAAWARRLRERVLRGASGLGGAGERCRRVARASSGGRLRPSEGERPTRSGRFAAPVLGRVFRPSGAVRALPRAVQGHHGRRVPGYRQAGRSPLSPPWRSRASPTCARWATRSRASTGSAAPT